LNSVYVGSSSFTWDDHLSGLKQEFPVTFPESFARYLVS